MPLEQIEKIFTNLDITKAKSVIEHYLMEKMVNKLHDLNSESAWVKAYAIPVGKIIENPKFANEIVKPIIENESNLMPVYVKVLKELKLELKEKKDKDVVENLLKELESKIEEPVIANS